MRAVHQPYHHGNVKDSLLAMAMEFIDANQGELISLRKLANAVGVTPSAVYNHFSDRNALMLAIKIRIYEKFNRFSKRDFREQTIRKKPCWRYVSPIINSPKNIHRNIISCSAPPYRWNGQHLKRWKCSVKAWLERGKLSLKFIRSTRFLVVKKR